MFKMRCILKTIDRPAMTLDVLREFSASGINILTMEVSSGRITTLCCGENSQDLDIIRNSLEKYPEIIEICFEQCNKDALKLKLSDWSHSGNNGLIFVSESMNKLISIAVKMADIPYPVLIQGESGTGKELFAKLIHNNSSRHTKPFIPVNCAALPESLMESEFFGYEAGAFTDANRNGCKGLFEKANHGTLFLDEFGELSIGLQTKLLRVLQERSIRRICGSECIPVDVKIIIVTNADLHTMVKLGQFRQDLYYRINILPLIIPPLRERPEDIPLLLSYFLDKYGREFNCKISLDQKLINHIYHYPWPGNVRELENFVIRCFALADEGVVSFSDLNLPEPAREKTSASTTTLSFRENNRILERHIIECLRAERASYRQIAKKLGVSHTTVKNRIKSWQLVDADIEPNYDG
ncbi:helix-turn-helix domain-containing protein [Salmonella enterica]|nr:helix-turn-helix domain-containing protein [Salmonella enterica]